MSFRGSIDWKPTKRARASSWHATQSTLLWAGAMAGMTIFVCAAMGVDHNRGGLQAIAFSACLGGIVGFVSSFFTRKDTP